MGTKRKTTIKKELPPDDADAGELREWLASYVSRNGGTSAISHLRNTGPFNQAIQMLRNEGIDGAQALRSLREDLTAMGKSKSVRHKATDPVTEDVVIEETPAEEMGLDPADMETKDEPGDWKHSAQVMASLHDHMAKAMDYTDGELAKMDNPVAAEALTKFKDEQIAPAMDLLKGMFGEHHCAEGQDPDEEMAKCMKSMDDAEQEEKDMEISGADPLEIGEDNLVDLGEIPPEEEEDPMVQKDLDAGNNCPECGYHLNDGDIGADGSAECGNCGWTGVRKDASDESVVEMDMDADGMETMSEVGSEEWAREEANEDAHKDMDDDEEKDADEFATDPDTEEILERYQTPKGWRTRKATVASIAKALRQGGEIRRTVDGRAFLVRKAMQGFDSKNKPIMIGDTVQIDATGQIGRIRLMDGGGNLTIDLPQGGSFMYDESEVTKKSLSLRKDLMPALDVSPLQTADFAPIPVAHVEPVANAAAMLKGLSVAPDMPEHHKDALAMHADNLQKAMGGKADPAEMVGKAMRHVKALGDAEDVPPHHQMALSFHGNAMRKCMKAMGESVPDSTDRDEEKGVGVEAEMPDELESDVGKSDDDSEEKGVGVEAEMPDELEQDVVKRQRRKSDQQPDAPGREPPMPAGIEAEVGKDDEDMDEETKDGADDEEEKGADDTDLEIENKSAVLARMKRLNEKMKRAGIA
jgi:hypothetical protein